MGQLGRDTGVRRAVLGAINQSDYMIAVAGNDRSLWTADCGFFMPGAPMATQSRYSLCSPYRPRSALPSSRLRDCLQWIGTRCAGVMPNGWCAS